MTSRRASLHLGMNWPQVLETKWNCGICVAHHLVDYQIVRRKCKSNLNLNIWPANTVHIMKIAVNTHHISEIQRSIVERDRERERETFVLPLSSRVGSKADHTKCLVDRFHVRTRLFTSATEAATLARPRLIHQTQGFPRVD